MTAEVLKRLFRAIYSEDITSLKKIAPTVIHGERKIGHNLLANKLESISKYELPKRNIGNDGMFYKSLNSLPTSKRNRMPLVSIIHRDQLKHHMILPVEIEERLLYIEKEYVARERLAKYNLFPKRKILIYGSPGCGKTLSAERIAWNLGLPLVKVRFDALLSSYFGESASNLREVFDYSKKEPVVLLLDECDFIAKSRASNQDVGEVPRIVNMLLTLLDEYDSQGLVIATTNLKVSLDEALFRRFDDVIEIPMPGHHEVKELLKMTLSAMEMKRDINWDDYAKKLVGHSAAGVVAVAQNAAKICVLTGNSIINSNHIEKSISEISMIF